MSNTIAVVIPLDNKEPYIKRAIASVLAQTRPVDEIIIVDDASTDGSLDRVKEFHDPRIKIILRTDPRQRGLPTTRNLGILSARSRWIALLDADDCWHEDFIEEIQNLITQVTERDGFLFTGWEGIWPDGRTTRDAYSRRFKDRLFSRLDLESFIAAWLRVNACPVFPSGVVIRRDILLAAGLFRERCRRGEDKEMWIRLLAITGALGSSRVCCSYYHAIPGAMNLNISFNARHCLCDTLDFLISRSSGTRRRLLMRLFNRTVMEYAQGIAGREQLSPELYRGFFVAVDPHAYLRSLMLRHMPVSLLQLLRRGILLVRRSAWT